MLQIDEILRSKQSGSGDCLSMSSNGKRGRAMFEETSGEYRWNVLSLVRTRTLLVDA